MRWFDIPLYALRSLIEAIPRLTAEESLMTVERAQVASGNMKREDASRIIRGWQRIADPTPQKRREVSQQEIAAAFGGLPGIEMIIEPAAN